MEEHEVLLDDIEQETIRPPRNGNKMTKTDAKENNRTCKRYIL